MRKLYTLACLLIFLVASCTKGTSERKTASSYSILGTWQIVAIDDGINHVYTAPNQVAIQQFIFSNDSSCTVINKGNTMNTSYTVRTDPAYNPARQLVFINQVGSYVHVHDTLYTLPDNFPSQVYYIYKRL